MQSYIVGIGGSLREGSRTDRVLALALEGAAQAGARTVALDLRSFRLPFFDDRGDLSSYPATVAEFLAYVEHADGLLLATPVYHGTPSGVLKNALDFFGLLGRPWLKHKVVGLASVAGGEQGANAITTLEFALKSLHAWVIPSTVVVPGRAFNGDDQLQDRRIIERLLGLGRSLSQSTALLSGERNKAALHAG